MDTGMAKDFHGIQPRTLSDAELVRYFAMIVESGDPPPEKWSIEVLRRLVQRMDGNDN